MKTCPCPDRHAPKIVCGYPMPCPHHTPECARKLKVLVVVNGSKKQAKKKAPTASRPWRRVRVRLDFTVGVMRPELIEISDPDMRSAILAAVPHMIPGVESIEVEPGGVFSVEMLDRGKPKRRTR